MIHALHGNLGQGSDWRSVDLADLKPVDLWEWQERTPGVSLEEFGERFSEEVAATDPAPVLLGYSLGGRLALQSVVARPDLWKAVILVSTHPGFETASDRAVRLGQDQEWAKRARNEDWASFLEAWNGQAVLAGQAVSAEQSSLVSRREAIASSFESWSLGHQAEMIPRLEANGPPLLVIAGGRDPKFLRLAECFSQAPGSVTVETIEGAGHRLLLEAPSSLAGVARIWLATL